NRSSKGRRRGSLRYRGSEVRFPKRYRMGPRKSHPAPSTTRVATRATSGGGGRPPPPPPSDPPAPHPAAGGGRAPPPPARGTRRLLPRRLVARLLLLRRLVARRLLPRRIVAGRVETRRLDPSLFTRRRRRALVPSATVVFARPRQRSPLEAPGAFALRPLRD